MKALLIMLVYVAGEPAPIPYTTGLMFTPDKCETLRTDSTFLQTAQVAAKGKAVVNTIGICLPLSDGAIDTLNATARKL